MTSLGIELYSRSGLGFRKRSQTSLYIVYNQAYKNKQLQFSTHSHQPLVAPSTFSSLITH